MWVIPVAIVLFIVYYEKCRRKMELNRLSECLVDHIKCNASNDTLEGIASACEYLGYEITFYSENDNIIGFEIRFFNDKRILERWIKPL